MFSGKNFSFALVGLHLTFISSVFAQQCDQQEIITQYKKLQEHVSDNYESDFEKFYSKNSVIVVLEGGAETPNDWEIAFKLSRYDAVSLVKKAFVICEDNKRTLYQVGNSKLDGSGIDLNLKVEFLLENGQWKHDFMISVDHKELITAEQRSAQE